MKTIIQATLVLLILALPWAWAADTAGKVDDTAGEECKVVTVNCDDGECQKIFKSIEGDDIDLDAVIKDMKADSSTGDKKIKVVVVKCADKTECDALLKDLKVVGKDGGDKKDATSK